MSEPADDRYVTFDHAPIRVTHLIHDLRPGGAEHVLVDLASVAEQAGLALSVVSMRPIAGFRYAEQLEAVGVPVASLDLAAWWDPRGPARLRRLLPELRPEILHSHLKHADVIAGRVATTESIPHVSTLHVIEEGVGWVAARKRSLGMRSRLRTAAATIAVSDAVRDWYVAVSGAPPSSVVTIHNGVPDPVDVTAAERGVVRRDWGVADDAILALMIAVVRPGKGHDVLVDAVAHLEDQRVVLVLAGDGPDFADLQARAGDGSRVVFAGFRDDVGRILAAADLVVHPSLGDALPTALVHALAAGRPIVASAVGGIPEIVPAAGGELVPAGDAVALAAAIDRLAGDSETRAWMGKQARARYEEEFTASMWADRLYRLYAELLGRA